MGGPGSGNWREQKTTVEESLVVSMRDLRKQVYQGAAGIFTWTLPNGKKSFVSYFVIWKDDAPMITLRYRWGDQEDILVPVRLETTTTQFDGRRWWLTCPLCVNGVACSRRVEKLYLPPGAKFFGCRKCHDLTYRSSQEAHQAERIAAHLGLPAEAVPLLVERLQGEE